MLSRRSEDSTPGGGGEGEREERGPSCKTHGQSVLSPPPQDGSCVLDDILAQVTHLECLPRVGGWGQGYLAGTDGGLGDVGSSQHPVVHDAFLCSFAPCAHPCPEWVGELSWRESGLLVKDNQ